MTDCFVSTFRRTFRAVAHPAALFLAAVTVAVGTLVATDPAPAYPMVVPDTLVEATIWQAEPMTGGIAFDTIDNDASGDIAREEFATWFATDDPTEDPFALFDVNADGAIDIEEWDVMAFELLD